MGFPSDLYGFTTLRNIHNFMQSEEQTKQVKILLHQFLRYLYKKVQVLPIRRLPLLSMLKYSVFILCTT